MPYDERLGIVPNVNGRVTQSELMSCECCFFFHHHSSLSLSLSPPSLSTHMNAVAGDETIIPGWLLTVLHVHHIHCGDQQVSTAVGG